MLMHFLETECCPESRTQFLRFATGRIALSSADRDGWLKVQVKQDWSPEKLPEPHTCVPRMDLAPHVSQEQLSSKMKQVPVVVLRLVCVPLLMPSLKAIALTVGGGMFAV